MNNSPEKLKGLIFTYPGQNSTVEGELKPWSKDGMHPFDQTITKVKSALGEEFNSKWAKPVVLFGVTCALSAALIYYLKKRPEGHMALSMGEMSSLVTSEAIDFDPMLEVMIERSKLASIPTNPETRLAVIVGPTGSDVENRLIKAQEDGLSVSVANKNTPTQTVIGGLKDHLLEIAKRFPDARRFLHIDEIERAFHTPHMNDIVPDFVSIAREILSQHPIRTPLDRIYSPMLYALTGQPLIESPEQSNKVTLSQLQAKVDQPPVWEKIAEDGAQIVISIDPKALMPGMIRGNLGKNTPIVNIGSSADMKEALVVLKEKYPGQLAHAQEGIKELDEITNSQT